MTKQEKQAYKNMHSIAYVSALSGIEVKTIEYGIEDYIIVECGSWTSNKSIHRVKLTYKENDTTFRLYGHTFSLNDAIRM